ncbi:MAG TPA: hypothetical protein PLQ67_03500, partial [Burkholderiaceae bacterium]|nr:hypothetical protein [Burkholderiaceae bacterium]
MNASLRLKTLLLVLFASVSFALWAGWPASSADAQTLPGPDFSVLVEQASGSVVNIRTSARVQARQFDWFGDEGNGAADPFYEFFRR